jgi:hypothetical protein
MPLPMPRSAFGWSFRASTSSERCRRRFAAVPDAVADSAASPRALD